MTKRLRVGAAKVDISPNQEGMLPIPQAFSGGQYEAVREGEELHARAIVIDNGETLFLFESFELGNVPHADELRKQIEEKYGTEKMSELPVMYNIQEIRHKSSNIKAKYHYRLAKNVANSVVYQSLMIDYEDELLALFDPVVMNYNTELSNLQLEYKTFFDNVLYDFVKEYSYRGEKMSYDRAQFMLEHAHYSLAALISYDDDEDF